jgi:hypothetical protein
VIKEGVKRNILGKIRLIFGLFNSDVSIEEVINHRKRNMKAVRNVTQNQELTPSYIYL